MNQYIAGGLLAAGLSAILTRLLLGYAKSKHLFMPSVRARDVHTQPTPRIGGIAVVGAFLLVVLGIWLVAPAVLNFTTDRFLGIDKNLFGVLLAIILLSVVNIADDYRSVPWQLRLVTEIIAAALIVLFGVTLPWLTNPFGGHILLGSLAWLLAIIWLVGLSNVVNWLDGVDGLASGVSAIALAVLLILSHSSKVNQPASALLAVVALGAVLGFLPFNMVRAKVFLGDTGSVFLGFLIGVLSIISGGKIATAFLVLAIPFLDAVVVLWSRVVHRQSPFTADRRHLHHRLLAMGVKPWQIVTLYYVVTTLFGLIALNTQTLGKVQAALLAVGLMAVLVLLYSYKTTKTNPEH